MQSTQLLGVLRAQTRRWITTSSISSRGSLLRSGRCLGQRAYSDNPQAQHESQQQKQRSPHGQWYSEVVPGMIPVILLGSAVYLGLQLTQVQLSNEKYLDEATAKITVLEREIEELRAECNKLKQPSTILPGPAIVDKRPSRWWFTGT